MFFKKKSLEDHLNDTKKVKIEGIVFKIKKIDPLSHLQGVNALQKMYDVYKINRDKERPDLNNAIETANKTKKLIKEILLAGVVSPKLKASKDGEGVHVDELLKDVYLSQELASKIILFTYKKKLKRLI